MGDAKQAKIMLDFYSESDCKITQCNLLQAGRARALFAVIRGRLVVIAAHHVCLDFDV